MTDFRALCAELANDLEEWVQGYLINDPANEFTSASFGLIDRARAALAEPQPAADGEVAATGKSGLQDGPAVQSREPVSVTTEPSDEELLELMPEIMRDEFSFAAKTCSDVTGGQVKPGIFRVCLNTAALEYARSVLAQWGTPNLAETRSSIEPIPVTERLPEAGDCNEAGRCWWLHIGEDGLGDWFQRAPYPSATSYTFFRMTHWLPCHALPLPGEQ